MKLHSPIIKLGLLYLCSLALLLGSLATHAWGQVMGPPQPQEGVMLSLARFESLFQASTARQQMGLWRNPQLEIDLSQVKRSGEAWVTFKAQIGHQQALSISPSISLDLVPAVVHPITVWLGDRPLNTSISGSFHQAQIQIEPTNKQKPLWLRLRYPVRLSQSLSGELSGLLPLPPVPSAQVKVISKGQARFIPDLKQMTYEREQKVSLRGALAILIPTSESGVLLQSKDLEVSLNHSGDGADVLVTQKSLLRGGTLQAWVPLSPAANALLSAEVDGKVAITDVRSGWHMAWLDGTGEHTVKAQVRVKVDRSSGQPRLNLSPQSAPRSKLKVILSGEREVSTEPSVPLTTKTLIRPPLSSNQGTVPGPKESVKETLIHADLPPLAQLTLRWTEKRALPEEESPEFLSETYQLFSLQEGLLKGQAQLEFDIIKGELKSLDIEVPKEVVLYHLSGAGVESWITLAQDEADTDPEAVNANHKVVRVSFGEPRKGQNVLSLKWQRVLSNNESLRVPIIRPLNAFQESGVIALYDGDRVGFTPAKVGLSEKGDERLIPVGQESIPKRILRLKSGDKVSQAFRHVQRPSAVETSTTTERARELRFDAQLDTLYSLRDGAVRAQAQLLLNLKSGRLDSLTLSVPKTCSEPQVTGPSINRIEPLKTNENTGYKRYKIKFTRRLEGAITLNVDLEQLLASDSVNLDLPRLIVEGAELTQGYIGLSAEAGLELSPQRMNELRRVSVNELPRSISLRAASELLYGYRFSRDWSLNAGLKRHKIIETLNAEVNTLYLRSYLLESGQRVDLLRYEVKNRDRRNFKVALPNNSTIQEVLVNQRMVKARAEGKYISIPIPKEQISTIYIRYEVKRDTEQVNYYELHAPSSDLRTRDIYWELFFSDKQQLWSWESKLNEISRHFPSYHRHSQGFESLGKSRRFHYDLLSANQKPLYLNVSFRGIISYEITKRLKFLAFFALLIIAVRRALLLSSIEVILLKHGELMSLLVLMLNLALILYQGDSQDLENALVYVTRLLLVVGIAVWAVSKISLRILKFLAERGKQAPKADVQVELSRDSSVETKEDVEKSSEAKTVVQNTDNNSGN